MPRRFPAQRAPVVFRSYLLFGLALLQLSACADLPVELSQPSLRTEPNAPTTDMSFEHGAFLGDAESAPGSITRSLGAFAQKVGSKPSIIKTFFRLDDDFSARGWSGQTIRTVQAAGVTNLVALDLRWNGAPATDLLNAIVRGDADQHIRRLAAGLGDLRVPVLLELAWEMNGNWGYAWQGVANGANDHATAMFIQAWRHVADVVRSEGSTNIKFVFSPNVGNAIARGLGEAHWNWYGHYYPGDSYVDIIGLHGFNGPSIWGGRDASFVQLFDGQAMDAMLSDVGRRFPGKPLLISEFASEESTSKPEWIRAAYADMKARPQIMGAIWFDMKKEADWRVDSSAASLASYREAIGTFSLASR